MNQRDPLVCMLGAREALNGEALQTTLSLLDTNCIGLAHLGGQQNLPPGEETLLKYLLGTRSKELCDATEKFNLLTKHSSEEVQVVVIDINLPLGDSVKLGDYTELKKTFPALKAVLLCCSGHKVLDVKMTKEEAALI